MWELLLVDHGELTVGTFVLDVALATPWHRGLDRKQPVKSLVVAQLGTHVDVASDAPVRHVLRTPRFRVAGVTRALGIGVVLHAS